VGPDIAAFLGAGSQTDQNKFDKTASDLVNAQTEALGSRATDAARADIRSAKPRRGNTVEANLGIINNNILPDAENKFAKATFIEEFVQKGLGDEQDALEAYQDNLKPRTQKHYSSKAPSNNDLAMMKAALAEKRGR
jgi:hypothetical protein